MVSEKNTRITEVARKKKTVLDANDKIYLEWLDEKVTQDLAIGVVCVYHNLVPMLQQCTNNFWSL